MSQMRVLVVDDSRTLRKVLARELQKMGIEQILEAEDGVALRFERTPTVL